MIRHLTLFFLILFSVFNVYGQLTFKPTNLSVITAPGAGDQLLEISLTNTQASQIPVYWKLIKDNTFKSNWETYICDLEFCYSPNVDQSNPSLPNNLKTGTHKFEFHFNPKGVQGSTFVTLKLYSDKSFTTEILSLKIYLNSTYLNQNPSELAINTTPSSGDNKLNITYTNSHDTTYTVYWKVIKDNTTWKPQWETYICDLEFCYGNNVDQSNPSLPNKFKKGNSLVEFHFFPNNVSGNTIVTLKLYADKNLTQELFSSSIQINNGLSSSDDLFETKQLTVTPNPALDFISLPAISDAIAVNILNSNGQSVKTEFIDRDTKLSVADLAPGIYFVRAYDAKSKTVGVSKFVKL